MHHALFLAKLLETARAAPVAEQHGEHVEHRHVGMADVRDVPTEMHVA